MDLPEYEAVVASSHKKYALGIKSECNCLLRRNVSYVVD